MRKTLPTLIFALACIALFNSAAIHAQSASPSSAKNGVPEASRQLSRKVKGRTLVSTTLPPALITFDKSFKYVGGQSFVLYDVANAEQHFFVDADKQGRIRRFYWVQFEGYLPNNKHTYNYTSKKIADIGGLDFIADSYPRKISANSGQRPDSDGSRAQAFLQSKGLRMVGDDLLLQRLVHMVDASKRDELMIIYAEDLSGTGLTAADLSENGRAAARWETMSKELLERAVKGIRISRR